MLLFVCFFFLLPSELQKPDLHPGEEKDTAAAAVFFSP